MCSYDSRRPTSLASIGRLDVAQETDDIVAIGLKGEFDLSNSPKILERARQTLDRQKHVILDLSEATFIDASVLRVILHTHESATACGRVAVLQLGTAAIVERALHISGVERVVPRAQTRTDAIQTVQQVSATSDPEEPLRSTRRPGLHRGANQA